MTISSIRSCNNNRKKNQIKNTVSKNYTSFGTQYNNLKPVNYSDKVLACYPFDLKSLSIKHKKPVEVIADSIAQEVKIQLENNNSIKTMHQ